MFDKALAHYFAMVAAPKTEIYETVYQVDFDGTQLVISREKST